MSAAKVAVVTGAGSGIGREVATTFLKNGYAVLLAGRREAELKETAALAPKGAKAVAVPTDITRPEAVAALFARAKSDFGRLDVLFNNAGTGAPPVGFEQITFDQWSAVVAVNLTGAFLCAQAAFRLMKEQNPQGGRIINNGSISAHTPRPFSAPYTSTKHAITGLTKSIALDGRPYKIACGQIDIGNAATPMTERMAQGVPQPNGTIIPEPRMDVGDIGRAVLMMAELPLDSNVLAMTIMATNMPFVGRG